MVAERDAIRDALVETARDDPRIVAAALIGSAAKDGGDRFSDLDLGFGVADDLAVADVLANWTTDVEHRFREISEDVAGTPPRR